MLSIGGRELRALANAASGLCGEWTLDVELLAVEPRYVRPEAEVAAAAAAAAPVPAPGRGDRGAGSAERASSIWSVGIMRLASLLAAYSSLLCWACSWEMETEYDGLEISPRAASPPPGP